MSTIDPPVDIPPVAKKLLQAIADQLALMVADADVRRAREQVVMDTHRLQQTQAHLEILEGPYREQIDVAKAQAEHHLIEVGQSFDAYGIHVKYRAGYDRVTYPTDVIEAALPRIATVHALLAREIESKRRVAHVSPKVEIEV